MRFDKDKGRWFMSGNEYHALIKQGKVSFLLDGPSTYNGKEIELEDEKTILEDKLKGGNNG